MTMNISRHTSESLESPDAHSLTMIQAILRSALVSGSLYFLMAILVLLADSSSLHGIFVVLTLIGFGIGGYYAAQLYPESPLTVGGISALLGYGPIQAIFFLILIIRKDISVTELIMVWIFFSLIITCVGIVGGIFSLRARTKRTNSDVAE